MIDEQNPVQVIDLVLQTGSQQTIGHHLTPRTCLVEIPNLHSSGARYVRILTGK